MHTHIYIYSYIQIHPHATHAFSGLLVFFGHRDLSMLRMDPGSITLFTHVPPSGYFLTCVSGIIDYAVQVHVALHVLRILNCKLNSSLLISDVETF